MASAQKLKVKVERKFIDKRTKKIHHVGDVISVTQRRFDEITSKDETLVSIVSD